MASELMDEFQEGRIRENLERVIKLLRGYQKILLGAKGLLSANLPNDPVASGLIQELVKVAGSSEQIDEQIRNLDKTIELLTAFATPSGIESLKALKHLRDVYWDFMDGIEDIWEFMQYPSPDKPGLEP